MTNMNDKHTDPSTPFMQLHRTDDEAVRLELQSGLLAANAHVAPKFLYDALGSRLFDAITELEEYYPTRTESTIFDRHAADMARVVGTGMTLVDLGAGNGEKAARLFPFLQPMRYVAVDISVEFLRATVQGLATRYPQMPMMGLGMDFSQSLELPPDVGGGERLMFYPGSSIGNFAPDQALRFLRQARQAARGGSLLIGVDLVKDVGVLQRAYDDALGVTAAFNLNLLLHLNRVLGTDFDVRQWRHVALFDAVKARVEMHLEAKQDLWVGWLGSRRQFSQGERIHTESSYKYTVSTFNSLLCEAGFIQVQHWADEAEWFAVFAAR